MEKILLAVDGSDNSFRALMKAYKIGGALKSKITMLNVLDDFKSSSKFNIYNVPAYDEAIKIKLQEESTKLLNSYMEHFKDYPGSVETLTLFGNPANTIIEFAQDGDYSLIVIGSRGLGAFSGAMLGSVSNKVVNKSKIDVLTVH